MMECTHHRDIHKEGTYTRQDINMEAIYTRWKYIRYEMYIGWSVRTEYTYDVVYIRWYINTERHTYGGDIHMEKQIYGKTYTRRGYTQKENIHIKRHTQKDIYIRMDIHGGTSTYT